MNAEIFREYDIRGIVDKELTQEIVDRIGRAVGTYFRRNNSKKIAVGYDARESSPDYCAIFTKSLNAAGCDVLLIGMVPTPVLYHSVYTRDVDGGVMITGSHNPSDHNGFKICLGEQTLHGAQIQELRKIVLAEDFLRGEGTTEKIEVRKSYEEDVISRINPCEKELKVVIDAGNGMGGVTAVPVYRRLGFDVEELFTNPDSAFPNHPPDPAVSDNLQDCIEKVLKMGADLGIAFDGDGDRITVIDNRGEIIWGDELTTLFAHEVLKEYPGSTVIGEVKCSQTLFDEVERLGGKAIMCKAGHSIVKAKMKERGALLAGEMSGHIFFADHYYGFDDACYAGARLLEMLSKTSQSLSEVRDGLPKTYNSPEIRIECEEALKIPVVKKIVEKFAGEFEVITVDGARIIFDDGWGLVRPSNTQAILVLRFEAKTSARLIELQKEVETETRSLIDKLRSDADSTP